MSERPFGGCHEDVGPVHACPICSAHMDLWCGMPQCDEEFGQPVLCPSNEQLQTAGVIDSASPTIAAFDTACYDQNNAAHQQVADVAEGSDCDSASSNDAKSDRLATPKRQKARQSVSTIHNRRRVVRWMESKFADGTKTLIATIVDAFPNVFNSSSCQSDLRKAARWWKARESLLSLPRGSVTVSKVMQNGRQLIRFKPLSERGKVSHWVMWMYPRVLSEFCHLRKAGLQFDSPLLRQVAVQVLTESKEMYTEHSPDGNGVLLKDKITPRWIQTYMEKNQIVLRAHTDKTQVSPEKRRDLSCSRPAPR